MSANGGPQNRELIARTANSASILREAHLDLLLDFFPKQDPQHLAHALLEARIMLVQAIAAPHVQLVANHDDNHDQGA